VPTKNYRLPSEWIQPHTTVVNVASFKNVDEDEILQIEGVQYVPMVGKVTGEFPCYFSPQVRDGYERFRFPAISLTRAYLDSTMSSSRSLWKPRTAPAPVAMLERNLMRLFYNFHHPDRQFEDRSKVAAARDLQPAPWYGSVVQLYTALAATAILGMMLTRSK